jgi:RNA polymerase sigma-70 factor (ECF subfamily)
MDQADSTCWTVIQGAAAGSAADRDDFVRRYRPLIRAYLAARWQDSAYRQEVDDGVQEVFLECFRRGGVLERANPVHAGGFRAFLYGVIRNVALRIEARLARHRRQEPPGGFDPAAGSVRRDPAGRVTSYRMALRWPSYHHVNAIEIIKTP